MRIVIEQPIETLPEEEQDRLFVLSRTNEVFCRDVNGILWQVLDLMDDDNEEMNSEAER